MTRERFHRNAITLVLGISAGFALVMAAREARAADTVASLLADPARLAAVQRGCKTNEPWASEALCRASTEAIRRRFRGGGVPYTPKSVDPFPSKPEPAPAKPQPEKSSTSKAAHAPGRTK